MQENQEVKFLSPSEASQFLGIARQTLAGRRSRGEAPIFYKVGKTVKYKKQDLLEFMEGGRIEPRK